MEFPSTGFLLIVYIQLSDTILGKYMQTSGFISTIYIEPLSIGFLLAAYILLDKRSIFATYTTSAMLNISTDYNKKLLNLAKIYINYTKYSGHINKFILKLAIFHNICLRVDILLKAKIKTFPNMFKSLALDYYYLNINISAVNINFDQVYNSIKNYFKKAEYK